MNLKQGIIQRLIQNRNQKPPKTLGQLWLDLQELEILVNRANEASRRYREEMRKGTERIMAETEARSHQSATTPIPQLHQPESKTLTSQQIYEAAQNPQKWERLMEDLSPQLKAMEAQYFGR